MEPWYRFAVILVKPLVWLLFRREFHGQERIPRSGGCVVVTNHISYADPFPLAYFVHDRGRRPRFLAKATLFGLPFFGMVLRGAKQIPVYRETADAALAFSAAVDAVNNGECVVIYPEGTVTGDPDYWPMAPKTGIARIALATGAPVIPVAQWGSQRVIGRGHKPRLFPRTRVVVTAGEPIDVTPWLDRPRDAATLRELSEHTMRTIATLLGEIRGETPPETLHVPEPRRPAAGDSRRSA